MNLIKALGIRMVDFDALAKKVIEDRDDQLASLKESNEALHALALRKLGRENEYSKFMADRKEDRNKVDNYSAYAKFYVPLFLHELEKKGKLKVGEKMLQIVTIYLHCKSRECVWAYRG